ncbi:MAG: hypothetical protein ACD_49C00056G0018, partial [uncultured bacterium (gcode 4)]
MKSTINNNKLLSHLTSPKIREEQKFTSPHILRGARGGKLGFTLVELI